MPVHAAAAAYAKRGTPVVVVAGERYGAGSARDWAAKVNRLLGVRAVLAVSFERIHRTNLVALGVLPVACSALRNFDGDHAVEFDVLGVDGGPLVNAQLTVVVRRGPADDEPTGGACSRRHRGRSRMDASCGSPAPAARCGAARRVIPRRRPSIESVR
jgi:aconitase A